MQFDQLSLCDIPLMSGRKPTDIQYRTLDNDGKIYCKIDWLTVIFFDCSMNHVLSWLRHQDCVSEFLAGMYEQSRGYDNVFKFRYNDIALETSSFGFYGVPEDESVFDVIVPKIRLELSGTALDYLRSIGIDMDTYRFHSPDLPEGGAYHFTRCDWAFDFINYQPKFLDDLIDHIKTHQLPSGRVPLASTNGAISYKLVTGGQKTVYLGSPQSDKMLRVYDKRLQHINLQSGTYIKDNPYNNPDSWIRIEWQTRNKFANDLVQSDTLEFKHILKKIFDAYAFADGTCDAKHNQRSVVPFWLKLFPWKEVENRIVQNASFVQYESADVKLVRSVESVMMRSIILYFSLLGKDGVQNAINRYLRGLDGDDPVSHRRKLAFYHKLNELSFVNDLSKDRSFGLVNNSGRLAFLL